tara:strand:+ start:1138 stop:1443 length:306 start_codon:yes stop_codon:yes gene_type:complete
MNPNTNNDITMNDPLANPLIVDCQGDMTEAFIAPEIHPDHLSSLPPLNIGDLVSTSDSKVGLILDDIASTKQNVLFYRVMINGAEEVYSALQLKKFEGVNQ